MTDLWHGGAPGREPGDLLLPPIETGLRYTRADVASEEQVEDSILQRSDRVYVTTDRELAQVFAAEWSIDGELRGGGWLYLVEAEEGVLKVDDDLASLPGVSFQAPSARVIRVWQRDVKSTPGRSREVLARVLADWQAVKNARESGQ